MIGHPFVFGNTGGLWQYVNRVAQVTNRNFRIIIYAFFLLILSSNLGLLGFGEGLVWIFYALLALGLFLLVVYSDPGTEKMIHDPSWGAAICLVIVAMVYTTIWDITLSILTNL